VEEVGLSSLRYFWAESDEILDTFKLMTKVMKTHGLKHMISTRMVLHFFCVSYVWEPTQQWNEAKAQRRDGLLTKYRKMADGSQLITTAPKKPTQLTVG
jgi:hypothetical protein